GGNGVRGIEALVGIDLAGEIGVGRHLPAREVDRLEAGADHLHRLIAGERAECRHIGPRAQQLPEPPRAQLRERMLDSDRATEPGHILWAVVAADAVEPAWLDRCRCGGWTVVEWAHRGLLEESLRCNIAKRTGICILGFPEKPGKSVYL